MNNILKNKDIINNLRIIYDYMKLNQKLDKSDLIIGCGCHYLEVADKCIELYKDGYADKILFTGGLGKETNIIFNKSEAEIYKDIALNAGVNEDDILIENMSTNTGDNFRFSFRLLEEKNINVNKVIIVHGPFSERRTLSSAKAIIKNVEFLITSPYKSLDEFLSNIDFNKNNIRNIISVIVGDIQRMIVFPQFGWQTENDVPQDVLDSYYFLKNMGFDKYILSKTDVDLLIDKFGIVPKDDRIYFN